MKKVLALVLAVIMVCTMAFAVGIGTSGSPAATPSSVPYAIVPGGTNYYVILSVGTNDNGEAIGAHVYFDKDGKFVPEKNVIKVDYAAGADLVASAGWVKVTDTNVPSADNGLVKGDGDTYAYQYQIVLKNDFARVADGKSFDFSISKITLTATGWEPQTLFKADDKDTTKQIKVDVGYEVKNVNVTATAAGANFNPFTGYINKITSIAKTDGTLLDSATLVLPAAQSPANGSAYASATLNKGANVYVASATKGFTGVDVVNGTESTTVNCVALINNVYNLPMTGVLEQTGGVNAGKIYNVYAKGMDGKVAAIPAALNNGVLTFSVPALSTVIVTTDTMTVTATASTTTTPGTTTNPGTGANDVVGVAAALAVVALVSGAAISLKK